MSFLSSLFGGTKTPSQTVQYQQASIPDYIQDPTKRYIGRAEELSQQDYTPFEGQRLAEMQPDELAAFERARNELGIGPAMLDNAYMTTMGSAAPLSGEEIQGAMNPFNTAVRDDIIAELRRQEGIQGAGDSRKLAMRNSWGARSDIITSERERNYNQLIAKEMNALGLQGYQNSVERLLAERGLASDAGKTMAQTGQVRQAAGYQDVAAQQGIGQLLRGREQEALDVSYQDFLSQRQFPYEQIGFLQNTVSGSPFATSTNTQGTTEVPGASIFSQLACAGIAGLGLWKAFM